VDEGEGGGAGRGGHEGGLVVGHGGGVREGRGVGRSI